MYEKMQELSQLIRKDGSIEPSTVTRINKLIDGDILLRVWARQLVKCRSRNSRFLLPE